MRNKFKDGKIQVQVQIQEFYWALFHGFSWLCVWCYNAQNLKLVWSVYDNKWETHWQKTCSWALLHNLKKGARLCMPWEEVQMGVIRSVEKKLRKLLTKNWQALLTNMTCTFEMVPSFRLSTSHLRSKKKKLQQHLI